MTDNNKSGPIWMNKTSKHELWCTHIPEYLRKQLKYASYLSTAIIVEHRITGEQNIFINPITQIRCMETWILHQTNAGSGQFRARCFVFSNMEAGLDKNKNLSKVYCLQVIGFNKIGTFALTNYPDIKKVMADIFDMKL